MIRVDRATASPPESGPLRRDPRAPHKQRPAAFAERFEERALVYDAFWHADGERILLVGPPPMNLTPAYATARYEALPSGSSLAAKHFPSLSTMITELRGAPAGTTALRMIIAGAEFELPVGVNYAEQFAGRRVLFSMNKDNDLAWIADWARWHARLQGTDAIILFDNGSANYTPQQVEDVLAATPGLALAAVPSWPGRFGMTDHALAINPYWSHFLQISSMSVVLRRFGAAAFGLLNCDVDELAATRSGRSIYDYLPAAWRGLVVFRGQWVEADRAGRSHRDYTLRHRDPRTARSGPKKWVLDPQRKWVQNLAVHPYWHWVQGRPAFGKTMPRDAFYRHFKAINTNWKEARTTAPDPSLLEVDEALAADFARLEAAP